MSIVRPSTAAIKVDTSDGYMCASVINTTVWSEGHYRIHVERNPVVHKILVVQGNFSRENCVYWQPMRIIQNRLGTAFNDAVLTA